MSPTWFFIRLFGWGIALVVVMIFAAEISWRFQDNKIGFYGPLIGGLTTVFALLYLFVIWPLL